MRPLALADAHARDELRPSEKCWRAFGAHTIEEQRLATALAAICAVDGQADGQVGDADPLEAVRNAVVHRKVDGIIVSTLPLGLLNWLRRNLLRQIERLAGLPVTHIVGDKPGG
ncbi:hypothetical protein [Pseudonocardia sp. NPDC049154]|uniref:hypothetical protein n=1 Tax=Pseudonocardia sp. NPDC049154 TaxID=3155501 RepID=UPI0033D004A2